MYELTAAVMVYTRPGQEQASKNPIIDAEWAHQDPPSAKKLLEFKTAG